MVVRGLSPMPMGPSSGGGSARDTLSALELIAATGGEVDEGVDLDDFLRALAGHDTGLALTTMAHAVAVGHDPRTVTEDLVRHLRNAFLALMAPELVVLPAERVAAVKDLGQQVGTAALVRAIERLGTTLVDLRNAPDPRVLVEVVLVQLTSESVAGDLEGLAVRVDRLQEQVRQLTSGGSVGAGSSPSTGGTSGIGSSRRSGGGVDSSSRRSTSRSSGRLVSIGPSFRGDGGSEVRAARPAVTRWAADRIRRMSCSMSSTVMPTLSRRLRMMLCAEAVSGSTRADGLFLRRRIMLRTFSDESSMQLKYSCSDCDAGRLHSDNSCQAAYRAPWLATVRASMSSVRFEFIASFNGRCRFCPPSTPSHRIRL